jgi:sugar lactone lactonase YvrE
MNMLLRGALLAVCSLLFTSGAGAWERGKVERFATLPAGASNPEGIAADVNGDIYVTGFDATNTSGEGQLNVFDGDGRLIRSLRVSGSTSALLGLAFHPQTHKLLVIDFGGGKVLDVDPNTGQSTVFSDIPGGGLNALAFDRAGNVYVSDSFRGIIWKTPPTGGVAQDWVGHPLLQTSGTPPFGANGLDFNRAQSALFVANTGNDTVVRIPVANGVPGTPAVFAHSINGADGLFVDEHDNLWVCANQSDEIVVVDPTGKAIAKLGDFDGLSGNSPEGLLFPASLVAHRGYLYVTNLSLDLRTINLPQSVDSQWAAQVTRHTVSRLRLRVP